MNILAAASSDSELQQSAITYWIINAYQNGYNQYPIAQIDQPFLPIQPLAGESKNLVAKPSQCYANPKAAVLRFRTLREDLQPHHAIFGVALDPPIDVCAERLIKAPPADVSSAQTLFGYFAGRLIEMGPNGHLVDRLGMAPIVPIVQSKQPTSKMSNVRFVTPRSCFLGDSQTYGDIFDFVDFGLEANTFLLRIGCKHEPNAAEIAGMLIRQPARLLDTLGTDKYLQLLRKIAENASNLKKDKAIWQQLKSASCLLAEKTVRLDVSLIDEKVGDLDDDATIKEYSLARASEMVLVDDFTTYRLFQHNLLAGPQEEVLENLYSSLETPWLSHLVEDDMRKGALLREQSPAAHLQKLLVERCRLFLHDHSPDAIRHDAKWLEQNMTVRAIEFLHVTRKLKGYRGLQFIEKRTAALHRESKKQAILYMTARYDLYEVSRAVMSLMLKRPKQQDFLALETIMESDLRRLKTKGYNVDRILRQKAAESRVAESERQRREEEQRLLAESEAASRPATQQAITNGPPPEMPDPPLAIPGAFADSPEQVQRSRSPERGSKKSTGLFSNISKHLGLNSSGPSGQQLQNLLTNWQGQDAPPPYQPHDPNGGKALGPGTEQVTSPKDLQSNLQSAIKSTREFNASSLFAPPETKEIKETPSYCDSKPGHDLSFVAELKNGVKLYLSRTHADPNGFLQANREALATFVVILSETAAIFELPPQTINIFHDEQGASIAFNSNGSLFCNLRYFMQLHLAQMGSPDGKVEAMAYWWITLCHELAHNLEHEHNSRHSFYTESFVAHYFRRMVWWASRVTT